MGALRGSGDFSARIKTLPLSSDPPEAVFVVVSGLLGGSMGTTRFDFFRIEPVELLILSVELVFSMGAAGVGATEALFFAPLPGEEVPFSAARPRPIGGMCMSVMFGKSVCR